MYQFETVVVGPIPLKPPPSSSRHALRSPVAVTPR
jgi:hypothetical protein